MRKVLILGGLALLLASLTLSINLYAKPDIVVHVVKGSYKDGVLKVHVRNKTLVAIVEVKKPVLVSVDVAGISIVKPAYLLAVSNKTKVGPASVLYLTPGVWRLYVIPLQPEVEVTIKFSG